MIETSCVWCSWAGFLAHSLTLFPKHLNSKSGENNHFYSICVWWNYFLLQTLVSTFWKLSFLWKSDSVTPFSTLLGGLLAPCFALKSYSEVSWHCLNRHKNHLYWVGRGVQVTQSRVMESFERASEMAALAALAGELMFFFSSRRTLAWSGQYICISDTSEMSWTMTWDYEMYYPSFRNLVNMVTNKDYPDQERTRKMQKEKENTLTAWKGFLQALRDATAATLSRKSFTMIKKNLVRRWQWYRWAVKCDSYAISPLFICQF